MEKRFAGSFANYSAALILSIIILLENVPVSSSSKELPTIMKIFDKPQPNDGYESLRTFTKDMTQGMFNGKQLYNTSIALTSSLFSFQLPHNSFTEQETVNLANQVIFGMFGFLTSVLIFALPVLLTGQRFNPNARSNSDDGGGIIDTILKTEPLARLIKNGVHKQIGLEPEKCMQKTICEAHRAPKNKEYGMLALPFQIFYPPASKDNNKKFRASTSPFQKAAYIGKYTKTKCGQKYNCFFDVLDLGRYLVDWYQYHHPGGVNSSEQKET